MNPLPLPEAVRSRTLPQINGLELHFLEAGDPSNPAVLLLHGFPDLAFGWRKVLPALASNGYHVLAPDLRGYGRTTGWSPRYTADLRPFHWFNLVRDLVALLRALKIERLHTLVGHDFGSPLAAYFALLRDDLLERLVLMSAPFGGAPSPATPGYDMDQELARLNPPRLHYQTYYSARRANADLLSAPGGVAPWLRAYFHLKSADWSGNAPCALDGWRAEELAKLPSYYVMPLGRTMPETVLAEEAPPSSCVWMTAEELAVYVDEFTRTGFQGGLNWYRVTHDARYRAELSVLYRKPILPPTWFLSGAQDWGNHQTPGALERLQSRACADFREVKLLEGAGHWVQQEQAAAVSAALLEICLTGV